MRAGERACSCPECGVICQGQFDGCPDVWARGPRPVSLTVAPAIDAPRVRALAPGPAQARPRVTAAAEPTPPVESPANGRGNGYSAKPPPPPPPRSAGQAASAGAVSPPAGPPARTEVLQWFEDAFDELRNELHAVVSAITRQQAMLAELLDSREAELRVVMVAESLPELAGEAAAKALTDQSDGLAEIVAASLDDFRAAMQASELSGAAVMDGMRELLRRVEITAEVNAEDAHLEGAARLESLKASVGRQLRPVSAGVAELAAYIEAAEEREAARTKALKASVTRQVQPLATAVEAAMARSDRQLAEIHARLDALGAPKVRPARAAAAPEKAAPKKAAKKAAPRKAAQPEPDLTSIVYDYEATPPEPEPATPLLLRRRPPRNPPLA